MHFFGSFGTILFVIGLLLFLGIGVNKVYHLFIEEPAKNIADMSAFYIALTSMIIGAQLFLAGFIGELINRTSQNRNQYNIKERF